MASEVDKSKFLSSESTENTLLLFTGGKGEPKCIDVERCIDELPATATLEGIGVLNPVDRPDFTDACPRVPLTPITFYFANDPSRSYSSFAKSRGVQFSYQAIYKKGFLSALAPYSNVAIPPAILSAGTRPLSELLIENTCVLEIPKQSAEVEGIRLIVREGNDGVARRIQDVYFEVSSDVFTIDPNSEFSPYAGYYSFYNDITGSVMSETDRLKTFDAVPRDAKAQEVAGDRVIYGNYTDGYSNIQTETRLSVNFSDAPPPGYSFDLRAVPVVFRRKTQQRSDADQTKLETLGGVETERFLTCSGFLIDDELIPSTVGAGVYEVNITLAPSKNFHQFVGQNDVPNSMENVDETEFVLQPLDANINPDNDFGISPTTYNNPHPDIFSYNAKLHPRDYAYPARRETEDGFTNYAQASGVNLDVTDQVGGSVLFGDENTVKWSSSISELSATFGKTCRSPLIYKGGTLSFSATLNISSDVSKETFVKGLLHALWGLPPTGNPIYTSGAGEQEYPLTDDEWFASHEFDLGLNDKDVISHENDTLSELICAVQQEGSSRSMGLGYGIVNSAKMKFCLEPARGNAVSKHFGEENGSYGKYNYEDSNGNQRSLYGVKLTLANVTDFDFKTCIPLPSTGFGSLISPDVANSISTNFDSFSDSTDKLKASLFQARATSRWDYDVSSNGSGIQLAWPSIERNLSIPSSANGTGYVTAADAYGPAKQNFAGSSEDWEYTETDISFVNDDNGIPYPAAGTISATVIDSDGPFKQRQTLWSDSIVENTQGGVNPVAWQPAPIESWVMFDDPAAISNSEWQSNYGFQALMTTADSFSFNGNAIAPTITGTPSQLLRNVSNYWEGKIKASTLNVTINGQDYCKFSLYRTTRPTSGTVDNYASNSPYSLVDGDMGPGGSANAGTRALGERGDGLSDGWGFPLAMGTHDLSNVDSNTVGKNANIKGSVTAFNLVGWTDNFPGYCLQNVSRNTPKDGVAPEGQLKRLAVSNRVFNHPFRNHPPRYFRAKNLSDNSGVIKESQGPILPYSTETTRVSTSGFGISGSQLGPSFESFLFPSFNGFPKQIVIPFTGASNGSALGINVLQSSTDSAALGGRSFKTKASHEFGIVYYDEKGRHGAVQPVGSVYVPGYDSERTSGLYGAANVRVEIFHEPPPWAKHYRIVYSGNTNVEEFFQYTVANAFVPPEQGVADKIYLSLSHLQSSEISYTSAYGAVSQQDGSNRIYRFAPGDTLRIINYADDNGDVVYMSEPYEYKVLGVENLVPSMDDHPLFSESQQSSGLPDSDLARNGEFLIIENNSSNVNFSSAVVATETSFWNRRCLVEVYRPKQPLGEDRPYYETNYGGRIIENGAVRTHQYNTINMSRGDVYFRAVPMNVQKIVNNQFVSLVSGSSSNNTSSSNFTPYFVETEGFTDSFVSSTRDYGRIHFVDRDASEVNRKYSLTFSEQTSLGSFQQRWLSFPQIGNFKDYSFEFGEIDLIDFDGQFINSFHENRVLKIPFQRNLLATGETDQVVASTKVLGTEAVVPIESGTFGHPESVIKIDSDYFFFDLSRKRVIALKNGKSPVVISDLGVRSYLKAKVDQWMSTGGERAPLGYDPRNKELLVCLSVSSDYQSSQFSQFEGESGRMMSMSFDLQSQKNWKTRYSFASSDFATMDENLISFHLGSSGIVQPWVHDEDSNRNNFYGQSYGTSLSTAFGGDPTQIKEFETIIVDAEYPWNVMLKSGDETSVIDKSKFKRYNDRLYGLIDGVSVNPTKALGVGRPCTFSSFPRNAYRGKWDSRVPELRHSREEGRTSVKMFFPSSHPMFKAPIPTGPNSLLYEKSQDGNLVPLGQDQRNSLFDQLPAYRISEISKNKYSNVTEVIVDMSFIPPAMIASIGNLADPNFPLDASGLVSFDFVPINQIGQDSVGTIAGAYKAAIFALSALPLISYYFSNWDPAAYEAYINSLAFAPGSNPYDLNEDGFVNLSDLLLLLEEYGSGVNISDILGLIGALGGAESGIYAEDADLVLWEAQQTNVGETKQIYSMYTNSKEPLIGRNIEIEMSSPSGSPSSDLFSVEVGFNSRNKSMSKAVRQNKKK